MARKKRIEKIGFYHIVNRGVARVNVFLCDEDYENFLCIIQEASLEYEFEIYSFCLMSNHYHLLLKTTRSNLSLTMQKINSRYSIYFNNKYKRVGSLWQGRFKSWYVYDESYLKALVKYIEFNPIKADIVKSIAKYRWAMSSRFFELEMLNFDFIDVIDFKHDLNEKEEDEVSKLYSSKLEQKEKNILQKKMQPLESIFNATTTREFAIFKAVLEGYKQSEIAKFLNLSDVSVSKILKIYKQKVKLFNKLRDKGIFWSYSKDISYEEIGENISVEYLLKYGDFDDIKLTLVLYGIRFTKKVWNEKLKNDAQFIKTNLMIARVFFGMDIESQYFKEVKNERLEKLRLLAS